MTLCLEKFAELPFAPQCKVSYVATNYLWTETGFLVAEPFSPVWSNWRLRQRLGRLRHESRHPMQMLAEDPSGPGLEQIRAPTTLANATRQEQLALDKLMK